MWKPLGWRWFPYQVSFRPQVSGSLVGWKITSCHNNNNALVKQNVNLNCVQWNNKSLIPSTLLKPQNIYNPSKCSYPLKAFEYPSPCSPYPQIVCVEDVELFDGLEVVLVLLRHLSHLQQTQLTNSNSKIFFLMYIYLKYKYILSFEIYILYFCLIFIKRYSKQKYYLSFILD